MCQTLCRRPRSPVPAGRFLQHDQRRIPLRRAVGLEHLCVDDQPVGILHQQVSAVAQLRLLAVTFARQKRLRIGLRRMRLIRSPLAAKVHRGIAGIVRRHLLFVLRLKNLRPRPGLQQRAVDG